MDESIDPETVPFPIYIEPPYFNEDQTHQAEENYIEQVGPLFQFQQNPKVGTQCVLGGFDVKNRFDQRNGDGFPFQGKKICFDSLISRHSCQQKDPVDPLLYMNGLSKAAKNPRNRAGSKENFQR